MTAYRTSRAANPNSNGGSFLEQQNDDMVEQLSQKVSKLKRVTIEIGENVRDQNRLIDDMGTGFSFSGELLMMNRSSDVFALSQKVSRLKKVAIEIGENVRDQNRLIDDMMMNRSSDVFAVFIPDSPDKKTFKEFKEVKEFLNSPDGRKEGARFKRCADIDELDSFYAESLNDEKAPRKTCTAIEPVSPYKSLPSYRFTDLRNAIEKKRNEDFDKLLKENPRILGLACNFDWLTDAYGTSAGVKERSDVLLDALLNTPDLIENNTPLHYACKFAQFDIVKLLTSFPICKKEQRNKYEEKPLDMLCRGFKGTIEESKELCKKITFCFSDVSINLDALTL